MASHWAIATGEPNLLSAAKDAHPSDAGDAIGVADPGIEKCLAPPGCSAVDDGAWHHLAAVYDGADLVLYVDGAEDARVTVGARTIDVVAGPRIGDHFSGSGQYGFRGAIDEVRIYDRVLGVGEVQTLAQP